MKVAGVRFRDNLKIYDFDATGMDISVGDRVIVDSERGLGLATVVRISEMEHPILSERPSEPFVRSEDEDVEIEVDIDEALKEQPEPERSRGIRKVLRKATEEDLKKDEQNRAREAEAFALCRQLIAENGLPMRLVRTEFSFDAGRATFFFYAETRVDFRGLVKDLAQRLHMRIEMRQIGVRDVARLIGGFGPCGRELCCASFLTDFEPVSIRMAKKQELVLNPAKISGVCGRLLCCLSYEYEIYDDIKKDVAEMRAAMEREKKEAEERRIAEEKREQERLLAEERKRQEQRREEEKRKKQAEQPEHEKEKEGTRPQLGKENDRQQEAGKTRKKRRRFWRKKKKSMQGGGQNNSHHQN